MKVFCLQSFSEFLVVSKKNLKVAIMGRTPKVYVVGCGMTKVRTSLGIFKAIPFHYSPLIQIEFKIN